MAEIVPFRGILYNTSKVKGDDVVAPPYDIITPEYKEELYKKSHFNIVRIDFGKEQKTDSESENKYTRAAKHFHSWIESQVLAASKNPCFYAHEIEYEINGIRKKLRGFFGLVKIEELGKGIYPHECTHSKPKTDRLNLMRACNANISPIFSLYNSPEKKASGVVIKTASSNKPYLEARDPDGAVHRVWVIDDRGDVEAIKSDLAGKAVFIADGHHRYETALEFQKEMHKSQKSRLRRVAEETEPRPWDYVLMFLANISEGDLTILPAHRLVKNLPDNPLDKLGKYFDISKIPLSDNIKAAISGPGHTIGFYQNGSDSQFILRYKGGGLDDLHPALRGLDVTVLHELIFKKLLDINDISYEMDPAETIGRVRDGLYDAAFFLNPTRVEDVERVALSGVRMPPKSTYFYPKLLTGLVINKFSE